jgi:archaellum component FlaF (FlaF/FlaG flagellin family)
MAAGAAALLTPAMLAAPALAQNAPALTATPSSLTYPSQQVGTISTPQTVTLANNSSIALQIIAITIAQGGFELSNNQCTGNVAPGGTCTFSVTFSPSAAQSYSSTLIIGQEADGGLLRNNTYVSLTGTGTGQPPAPFTFRPGTVNFGSVADGKTSTQKITVTNTGSQQVETFTGLMKIFAGRDPNLEGQGFSFPKDSCEEAILNPGASCTVSVQFTAFDQGFESAALTIQFTSTQQNPFVFTQVGTTISGTGL